MKRILGHLFWAALAAVAALCLGGIAIYRGEHINSIWLVLAAACTYLVGFRFYGKFIAAKVMALDDQRATPAERLRNGHDFEPTNKWILFGHHFAAIAGPGQGDALERAAWTILARAILNLDEMVTKG